MATRATQTIQAKTYTEHIPGWESEDGTLVTSIQSNEYLIIILSSCRCIISNHTCSRKKAQVPPEWFPTCQYAMQTKAMLQHPHWCDARHVICLHCTTDERKGSGLVESDENGAAGRFVTANPNKQSRGLRPTCQLLDLLQTEKYQQLAMRPRPTKCLKPCKSGFLMVSYGFPKKKRSTLRNLLVWEVSFETHPFFKTQGHIAKATPMASSKAGCTLSTCWHCPMTSVKELSGNGFRCECVPKCNQAAEQMRRRLQTTSL